MGKVYSGGIVSPKGFDLSSGEPVDQRTIVATIADIYTLAHTYPGIEVKVADENYAKYRLTVQPSSDSGNWMVVGATGIPGADGADGIDGDDGVQGIAGIDGTNGIDGNNGVDGATGTTGEQGPIGPTGATGDAGSGVTVLGSDTTANIIIKTGSIGDMWIATTTGTDDGSNAVAIGDGLVYDGVDWLTAGPIRGPQGLQGDPGAAGTNGTGWTAGSYNGTTGIVTFDSTDGLGFLTTDLRGAIGATGADGADGIQGIQGIDGPTGPQGIQGDTGLTGADGPAGVAGDTGLTGPQGPQGIQGEDGVPDPYASLKLINSNYTTLDADSNFILNVKDPVTTITLDSSILTDGFQQQVINDTTSNITVEVTANDFTTGDGTKIFTVPIGHFAFYVLSSTNTWSVTVGVSDSNEYLLKTVYEGSTAGVVKDSDKLGGLVAASYWAFEETVIAGETLSNDICVEHLDGKWYKASANDSEVLSGRLVYIASGTVNVSTTAKNGASISWASGATVDIGKHIYLSTTAGDWSEIPPVAGTVRLIGRVNADTNNWFTEDRYFNFFPDSTSVTSDGLTINGIEVAAVPKAGLTEDLDLAGFTINQGSNTIIDTIAGVNTTLPGLTLPPGNNLIDGFNADGSLYNGLYAINLSTAENMYSTIGVIANISLTSTAEVGHLYNNNRLTRSNADTPVTVTVLSNYGRRISNWLQEGLGQITFVASGVTIITAETLKTRKQGSLVSLVYLDATTVLLTGDLELL